MTIRPATDDDVPQVLPMVQRLAELHETWDPQRYAYLPNIGRRYDRWLRSRASDPHSVFLVAEVPQLPLPGGERVGVRGQTNDIERSERSKLSPLTPALSPRGEREIGTIVGFAVATTEASIPIYRVEQFGFLHDLWVEQEYRHEGVARQMMMLVIERFKQMGVRQVRLETAAANEAARALFGSCGFRVATIEMMLEM
jgi:ribosomal protein S18 acetylase RimI-like enzyme